MIQSVSILTQAKFSQAFKPAYTFSLLMTLTMLTTVQTAQAAPDDRSCETEKWLLRQSLNHDNRGAKGLTRYDINLGPYFSEDILTTFPMRFDSSKYWVSRPTKVISPSRLGATSSEFIYRGYLSLKRKADVFPIILLDSYHGIADRTAAPATRVIITAKKLGGFSETKIKACAFKIARTPTAWDDNPFSSNYYAKHLVYEAVTEVRDRNRFRNPAMNKLKVTSISQLGPITKTFPAFPLSNTNNVQKIGLDLPRQRRDRLDSIYVVMVTGTHRNPYWSPTVELSVDAVSDSLL